MPELPEVETIRRQLAPAVEGRRLVRFEVLDPRWCEPLAPQALADAVLGREVERLVRHGKYLDWQLSGEIHLLMHLRMTGTLLLEAGEPPRYARVRIEFDDLKNLWLSDPRRFGTGQLVVGDAELERFVAARLGIEPFDERFGGAHLRSLAKGRRGPIKSFLLDQRNLAGVGNIYADEALWRARLHWARSTATLTRAEAARVVEAVRGVLGDALDAGGTSFDSMYVNVNGESGYFGRSLAVYGRAGQPCGRCGTPVRRDPFMNRSAYSCPRCQPRPRARIGRL